MDYLDIILQGYFHDNNREYLEKYFYREFKKAEKDFFDADEFFNGCLKIIDSWEQYLKEQVWKEKSTLYLTLNAARNGEFPFTEKDGKSIEQQRGELINSLEKELSSGNQSLGRLGGSTFTVHLFSLTGGRVAHNMYPHEVLNIKYKILEAYKKAQGERINGILSNLPESTERKYSASESKPVFNAGELEFVFDVLKPFFSNEEHADLRTILETGDHPKSKLFFRDHGNRLTDTFRKLIENHKISGCQKQDLINWIMASFTFKKANKPHEFVRDTVEKIISRNAFPCKNPLIEINEGNIEKALQPRIRRNNKY